MTKIPLTRTQQIAMSGLIFVLAFLGTICFVIAIAALLP